MPRANLPELTREITSALRDAFEYPYREDDVVATRTPGPAGSLHFFWIGVLPRKIKRILDGVNVFFRIESSKIHEKFHLFKNIV